jgi:hypothetical protein
MADAATEIDLDSVIDRLLEGEPGSNSLMHSGAGDTIIGRWTG